MTATATDGLRALLRRYRDARRWSQERTASECDMDHSLLSRLESGQRNATRETIERLIAGMGLTDPEADALRIAAGYLPRDPAATIADEPALHSLYRLMKDEMTPLRLRVAARRLMGDVVALLTEEAR